MRANVDMGGRKKPSKVVENKTEIINIFVDLYAEARNQVVGAGGRDDPRPSAKGGKRSA